MYPLNHTSTSWYYNATVQLNRYFTIAVFCFGVIGNVLNILILSQKLFRSNPCLWLFLISSYANLSSILFGLTTRIASGWSYDLTDSSRWFCKIRVFVVFTSRTIAFWLIALATIERWASSCISTHYRKIDTLRKAQTGTLIIVLVSILFYAQMFYCYETNLILTPLKCYGKTYFCRHLTDITYGLITVLSPLSIMLIFGFLTIINVRRSYNRKRLIITKNRTQSQSTKVSDEQQKRLKKKIDHHLLFILLIQVCLHTILTVPQAIHKIYSTFVQKTHLNSIHQARHDFLYCFVLLLSFIANGMPFYIYTLFGGNIFRKGLRDLTNMIRSKMICSS